MLVIAVDSADATAQQLSWTGRRHDDDGTESTGASTAQGLFEAVFHALHDGEQVAIGFDCPLTVASRPGRRRRLRCGCSSGRRPLTAAPA